MPFRAFGARSRGVNDVVQLILASREVLDARVRKAILALGPKAIPSLVAFLDGRFHEVDGPGKGWAPTHAVDLLVDLKATGAIAPILDVLEETELDEVVHERIVRRLPELGEAVVEPALARYAELEDAAAAYDDGEDPQGDEGPIDSEVGGDERGDDGDPEDRERTELEALGETAQSLCAILARLGVHDPRIFDLLDAVLDEDPPYGAMLLADYGDPRALPRLRDHIAGYRPSEASESWAIDFNELLEDYRLLGGTFDDALKAHVDALQEAARSALGGAKGKSGGAKVGRNDACPCGSGKKFKRCCGLTG
jgi:hypothetical protein